MEFRRKLILILALLLPVLASGAQAQSIGQPYREWLGLEWREEAGTKPSQDCLFQRNIPGAQGTLLCVNKIGSGNKSPMSVSSSNRSWGAKPECGKLPGNDGFICSRRPDQYGIRIFAPFQKTRLAEGGFECIKIFAMGSRPREWENHLLCAVAASPATAGIPMHPDMVVVGTPTEVRSTGASSGTTQTAATSTASGVAPIVEGVSPVRHPIAMHNVDPEDRAKIKKQLKEHEELVKARLEKEKENRDEASVIKTQFESLRWQNAGPVGSSCLHINDPGDTLLTLGDNYLCGEVTKYFHWSVLGPIDNMKCRRLFEPNSGLAWADNYLCVSYDFPYDLHISIAGELTGLDDGSGCTSLNDGAPGWADNYLCWSPNDHYLRDIRAARREDAKNRLEMKKLPPLGPVFGWGDDMIEAYAQKLPIADMLDFVNELTKTERNAVQPHLTTRQKHALIEFSEMELTWSHAGPLKGHKCIQITEVQAGWDNVFLCSRRDHGLKWSNAGRLAGMKCTSFFEHDVAGKESQLWSDNFLCAPESFEYDMLFVSDGKIAGMQEKCIYLSVAPAYGELLSGLAKNLHDTNESWNDNWLCYDRDKLISVNGHWEQATPPCPSCPEIDYSVSYGVEQGQEKSEESSFGMELSMSIGTSEGVPGIEEVDVETTTTVSSSFSSAVAKSFSRTKTEEITVPCHLGAVWQWVSNAERECSFGSECPALTAHASIIQCAVPGDEPIHHPNWSPCEPVFVDNLTATSLRHQNAGTRSDVPGGWRCRNDGEIIIEAATYGRSCNAPVGNVTDLVAVACQGSNGACEFDVDMRRLGRPGGQECRHSFEAFYTCPKDGDQLREVFVAGEAGYNTKVLLSCAESSRIISPAPRPAGWKGAFPDSVSKDAEANALNDNAAIMARPPAPTEMTINSVTINTPDLTITAPSLNVETPEVTVSADSIPVHTHSGRAAAPQPARTPEIPYCIVPMPQQNQCAQQSLQPLGQGDQDSGSDNTQPYDQGYQNNDPDNTQPYDQGYQNNDPDNTQPFDQGYQNNDPDNTQPYDQGYQDNDPDNTQPYDQGYQDNDPDNTQPYDQGYQNNDPDNTQPYDQGYQNNDPDNTQPFDQGYQNNDPDNTQPYDQGYDPDSQ